ncbi:hypothetical protein [uncultured Desulfobacter sp.]|uniref:hypothetical protein n=1 Tax=uncultured Desulfobacter sp. TaxID=240139 RepID=UPI0029C892F8|nr:hypothetical protein [uncultured Desulfobacter sp.]
MKKFFVKIIVFFIPIFLICFLLEFTVRAIPNDYTYKRKYLETHADLEILILGSSHSLYGIDPDYLSKRAFNASNVSQSPKFDFFIFDKFNEKIDSLKFVILPISYFSLFSITDFGSEKWREKNYVIYYDYPNGSFSSRLELFNGTIKQKIESIMAWLLKDVTNKSCSEYGYGLKWSNTNQRDLHKTAVDAAKRHTHTVKNNIFFEENKNYIEQIIKKCLKKDINVILYTPPAWYLYVELLEEMQLEITRTYCYNLTKKYSNVHYFDFLNDERFLKGDFRDADHTNHQGAKKLTLILESIIKSLT